MLDKTMEGYKIRKYWAKRGIRLFKGVKDYKFWNTQNGPDKIKPTA